MGDNCGAVAYPIAWPARTKRASQHILYTVGDRRGRGGWGGGIAAANHKAKAAHAAVAVNFVQFFASICRISKAIQAGQRMSFETYLMSHAACSMQEMHFDSAN